MKIKSTSSMQPKMMGVVFLTICLNLPSSVFCNIFDSGLSQLVDYQNYYEWKKVEYKFANDNEREQMIKDGKFIQENCVVTGAKVFKDKLFLTTPRYKPGVSFTLNVVPYSSGFFSAYFGERDPSLTPFPSAEMNQEGNCSAFQLVQGMEIDQFDRLWVVDVGRTALFSMPPNDLCPAKIVVLDLKNKNKIISSYEFPSDVVSPTGNALKDTTVACTSEDDCFIYITDIFANTVTVFDYKNKKSWAVSHPSMAPKPDKINFTLAGTPLLAPFGIAGSAVSPKNRNFDAFYYSPIADTNVYVVKTADLKSSTSNFNLTDDQVHVVATRKGQSDGWAMTNKGKLYFGNLPQNSVDEVQTSGDINQTLGAPKTLVQNKDFQWPDIFAFDNNGWLLLVTNKFQLYGDANYDWNQVNFRLVRFPTQEKAYSQDA